MKQNQQVEQMHKTKLLLSLAYILFAIPTIFSVIAIYGVILRDYTLFLSSTSIIILDIAFLIALINFHD